MPIVPLVVAALLWMTTAQKPPFTTSLPAAEMEQTQAVVETSAGTFVIDLRPELAPNHVGYFIKLAREGAYNGTIFHRVVTRGIIQGGDPLSKDPAKAKLYGTGGLGILKAEPSTEPVTRGAVAAVLQPNRPDSGGAQFFVCVTDQPALDGKYTIFGRVSEGLDVVQAISEAPATDGVPSERIAIASVTIRKRPPPEPVPFATEPDAALAKYRVVLETTAGAMTIELFADKAPGHVRNFLRLAQSGVYDGTAFHRVVPGFVIQTGSLGSRGPLTERQQTLVSPTLSPEFSDISHVAGIVSMARGAAPDSASTSFFIVTGDGSSLDGTYSAFGRVVQGMEAVRAIEQAPVAGEAPVSRIEITAVRIVP